VGVLSINQPRKITTPFLFYPKINQSLIQDPGTDLKIFGFRGYACDRCLICGTKYVAFVEEGLGLGALQEGHLCDPTKLAAAEQQIDKAGQVRYLSDKIPLLIKQKVDSWTKGN